MDTRSEKKFVFLPYRQIERNFYAFIDKELAYHGKQFVDELAPPRNTQLLSIYTWFTQLTQFGLSEKLKSRLATAALIELKNQIYGEYYFLSPNGGYLNWGSLVYKSIDKIIGITEQNPLSNDEEKELLIRLAEERENIIAKSSMMNELNKELEAKKGNNTKEKSHLKSWDQSSSDVIKPESAQFQKFYLWKVVHRDIQKRYNDKKLYTLGMLHFRSYQQPAQLVQTQVKCPIIPLTKQPKK